MGSPQCQCPQKKTRHLGYFVIPSKVDHPNSSSTIQPPSRLESFSQAPICIPSPKRTSGIYGGLITPHGQNTQHCNPGSSTPASHRSPAPGVAGSPAARWSAAYPRAPPRRPSSEPRFDLAAGVSPSSGCQGFSKRMGYPWLHPKAKCNLGGQSMKANEAWNHGTLGFTILGAVQSRNFLSPYCMKYRIIEGSLETKVPTIWTDEKQHSQEEAEPGRNSDV